MAAGSSSPFAASETPGEEAMADAGDYGCRARAIAFYLPQFHPIPENDEWWGKGFTEWRNVARARPLYRGHWQPNVPADLGFYDLRLAETRQAQADLASAHGIEGFCYWHYWFAGRTLLDRPFREVLQSGEPRFGFCLGWANESWSGVWHGAPDRALVEQTYPGMADHARHFEALLPAFCDDRYLRVRGKPIFYIYRPTEIPELERFLDCWRSRAVSLGLGGVYFVGGNIDLRTGTRLGLDAVAPNPRDELRTRSLLSRLRTRVAAGYRRGPRVYPYRFLANLDYGRSGPTCTVLPCVISNWDNTPRSGRRGVVFEGSTPELFASALRRAVEAVDGLPSQERVVWIKSWNEWAEGNYIEPDTRFGQGYLRAAKDVILSDGYAATRGREAIGG